jgi:hypothetical protein
MKFCVNLYLSGKNVFQIAIAQNIGGSILSKNLSKCSIFQIILTKKLMIIENQ